MIEQGLYLFVQAGLTGLSPAVPGGFGDILPADLISTGTPYAWVYKTISSKPDYTTDGGEMDWTEWNVQIDCHGLTKANAITLRKAIADKLSGGFTGRFADPDATFVFAIYEEERPPSMFSDSNRTFVEALEYRVIYKST